MRNVLCGVLGFALLLTSCAASEGSLSGRPNSAQAMVHGQQGQPKDPHDYVTDPTIGNSPPETPSEKPLCRLQCGPNMHCDASGMVERCVRDEAQKP